MTHDPEVVYVDEDSEGSVVPDDEIGDACSKCGGAVEITESGARCLNCHEELRIPV